MSFWSKLAASIVTSDWYILAAAVAAVLCFVLVLWARKRVDADLKKWEAEQNLRFTRHIYNVLTIFYTLFITIISLFPLFGMFGTVSALLGLDLSSEAAISTAKNGFFDALTSTTWGIVFAVIFKLVNAVFATAIENDIQRTGDDTSGREWERTKKYGINTLAFRMMQHGAFYQVDADCVGITCDVPWEKNAQWLDVLAKSGTPLFVSIGEDAFTLQVETAIRAAFETADKTTHVSTPVDWLETKTPRVWDSQFTRDTYNW